MFWVFLLAAACVAADDSPIVMTEAGEILGAKVSEDLWAFNGVPYASPPVGHLRFKPPAPAVAWTGVRNATEPGSHCIQNGCEDGRCSEDCLFLNVLTPSLNPKANLPVLVYIHGGGSEFGYSDDPTQNQTAFAEMGLVTVTINYRLNVFGYFALSELSKENGGASGNQGVEDCQLALRWVQNNIHRFGGDKSRVLVYGQSSGGTQILAMLVSPASKGLFAAAVSLSGSPKIDQVLTDVEDANRIIVTQAGCDSAPEGVLSCLRSLPAASIFNAIPWQVYPYWNMGSVVHQFGMPQGPPFEFAGGLVIVDGKVVPMELYAGLADPSLRMNVPSLFATMEAEIDLGPHEEVEGLTESQLKSFFETSLANATISSATIQRALALYTVDSAHGFPQLAYEHLVNDLRVFCGNARAASATPTGYLVQSTHAPSAPCAAAAKSPMLGANERQRRFPFHTWDLLAMLRTGTQGGCNRPSSQDDAFGAQWRKIIHALATDPADGARHLGLETHEGVEQASIVVNSESISNIPGYRMEHCKLWGDLIVPFSWNN